MGDDGLGLAALERLPSRWRLPPLVRPVDGGTLGLSLLPLIEEAEAVLLLDAIDAGQPPGSLVRLNATSFHECWATGSPAISPACPRCWPWASCGVRCPPGSPRSASSQHASGRAG